MLEAGYEFEGEAFEVFGFGEVSEDGVVGALGMGFDEAKGFFSVVGGGAHAFEKEFASGMVGATEGSEMTSFF